MEEFRKKAKTARKIYIAVLIAAAVLAMFFNVLERFDARDGQSMSKGFSDGFCAGMVVFMSLKTAEYTSALKDDEKLKKLYIRETDERTRLICEKSNSAALRTFMVVLGLSAIPASYLSETVFYTLLAALFVLMFIKVIFDFYYRRKF